MAGAAAAAAAAAATAALGRRFTYGLLLAVGRLLAQLHLEIDNDVAWLAGDVAEGQLVAVALTQLVQQRQRIVIVDEAHGVAVVQRFDGAENGGMTETLGYAARVEGEDVVVEYRQFAHGRGPVMWVNSWQDARSKATHP